MIILSSPTKQMDFKNHLPDISLNTSSEPVFKDEAGLLNDLLKEYDIESLASLMKISPSIASETHRNIKIFNSAGMERRPALFSYSGTVFKALEPRSLNPAELSYTQAHFRILSGLYGILRPLDLISAYRLEMKTNLDISGEGRLSVFWKSRIASALASENALAEPDSIVINLASGEYSRILDKRILNRKMINFHFKENTDKGLKTVGMYAKTARGLMIHRMITEQIKDPLSLKKGLTGGYAFEPEFSSEYDWTFVR